MQTPRHFRCSSVVVILFFSVMNGVTAQGEMFLIDDRSSSDLAAASGGEWRLITDGVMGGVSDGRLLVDVEEDQGCLRLQGDVKLDNNGGFVQAALDLTRSTPRKLRDYAGLMVYAYGNDEQYNVHLRTQDNWLPWQSYRATFTATPEWKKFYLPFTEFKPYRTSKALNIDRLRRIGIVAIGREFRADICIGELAFY
jgi:hypothetical protein